MSLAAAPGGGAAAGGAGAGAAGAAGGEALEKDWPRVKYIAQTPGGKVHMDDLYNKVTLVTLLCVPPRVVGAL